MDDQEKRIKIQTFFKNPFVIIGIVIQIIFIILVIFLIQNITKKETINPNIEINHTFDSLPADLPDSSKSAFESAIYEITSLNQENIGNIASSGVIVREGSIKNQYLNELNLHYLSFIVDIPSIQQSYHLIYRWSDDKNNRYMPADEPLMAICLPKSQMIYPDFNCRDSYNGKGPQTAVYFLKNYDLKVNNQSFSITPKGKTNEDNFYYQVAINTCGNEELKNQANQVFEKQIQDLGFDISEIPHQTIGYCDK